MDNHNPDSTAGNQRASFRSAISLACILISLFGILFTWVNFNQRIIKTKAPDALDAAKAIAVRYDSDFGAATFEVLASNRTPTGEIVSVLIRTNEVPVAFLCLKSFLGLGWQEQRFIRF